MISSLVTEPQSRPKPRTAPIVGVLRRDLVGATLALALLTVSGFLLFGADVVLDARTEQLRNQAVAYVRATDDGAASLLAARFRQNRQLNQASRWVSLVAALIPALGILVFLSRLYRRDRELSLESGRGRRLLTEKTKALERADAELAPAIAVARRLDRHVPHTIKISMDFVDGPGNDIVRVFVDGELKHIGTSWENYYFYDANGASSCSSGRSRTPRATMAPPTCSTDSTRRCARPRIKSPAGYSSPRSLTLPTAAPPHPCGRTPSPSILAAFPAKSP